MGHIISLYIGFVLLLIVVLWLISAVTKLSNGLYKHVDKTAEHIYMLTDAGQKTVDLLRMLVDKISN